MTFSKGSTYVAVVPLTNSFGLYQIPEPEPGQLMFPINLVLFQMTSEVRYEIKNFITCYLTWNFDTKKSRLVRTQRTNNDQLILVDPVEEDVEDSSTDWSSKLLTMRSK